VGCGVRGAGAETKATTSYARANKVRGAKDTYHEVVEEVLVGPGDAGILVGLGVAESVSLAGLAVDETTEVRALLVGGTL